MKTRTIVAISYATTFALSAFTLWLTGYNFDERNTFVASWFFLTMFAGCVIAGFSVSVCDA